MNTFITNRTTKAISPADETALKALVLEHGTKHKDQHSSPLSITSKGLVYSGTYFRLATALDFSVDSITEAPKQKAKQSAPPAAKQAAPASSANGIAKKAAPAKKATGKK